jgi:hypothetical protein
VNTTTAAFVGSPETAPGTRLVSANLQGVEVYVPCPEWCVVSHAQDEVMFVQDISHYGAAEADDVLPLAATLVSYPYSGVGAQVAVDFDGEAYELNRTEALTAADELRALADRIEALAAFADEVKS